MIGSFSALTKAGAPTAYTNEVQTITKGDATGGTFKLTFGAVETAALNWNCSLAEMQAALRAISTINGDYVTCSGGPTLDAGAIVCTFGGILGGVDAGAITVTSSALTGGTNAPVGNVPTVAETTKGVEASYRGAPTGSILTDTTNQKLYYNTGTPAQPAWSAYPVI